jgi:hypothetical protein
MAPKDQNGTQGEPGVAVYQGLPDVEMVVAEGNVVSPSGEDKAYEEGEHFTVDGPTAIALTTAGHAHPAEKTEK